MSQTTSIRTAQSPAGREIARAWPGRAGDFLPPLDALALLIAAPIADAACAVLSGAAPDAGTGVHRLALVGAVIAPFILWDPRFADLAGDGDHASLTRGFARRCLALLSLLIAITYGGGWLDRAGAAWPVAWLSTSTALWIGSRVALARALPLAAPAERPARTAAVGDLLRVRVLTDRPIRRWDAVLKALLDYSLAGLATLALSPLLALVALAIRLDSPGPVLFKQRRHGLNNREFDIYKFRTMRVGASSNQVMQQTQRGDPRCTPLGLFLRKWSIDELPQLLNVLRGDMSLVGPRPHAVVMRTESRLCAEIIDEYPHRHRVKPGITGWAQVNGARGATETAEQLRRRIELDLWYIDHWSPWLDFRVILRTFRAVVRATNAF